MDVEIRLSVDGLQDAISEAVKGRIPEIVAKTYGTDDQIGQTQLYNLAGGRSGASMEALRAIDKVTGSKLVELVLNDLNARYGVG